MTDNQFLEAARLVSDFQEIFWRNVQPHLLGIEHAAADAQDEKLSALASSMRKAFEEDDLFKDLPLKGCMQTEILAIMYKAAVTNQMRVVDLWSRSADRIRELRDAGILFDYPQPPAIHWPIQ
jgi:hypothetical protein